MHALKSLRYRIIGGLEGSRFGTSKCQGCRLNRDAIFSMTSRPTDVSIFFMRVPVPGPILHSWHKRQRFDSW